MVTIVPEWACQFSRQIEKFKTLANATHPRSGTKHKAARASTRRVETISATIIAV
jgi:hypothetical protein